MIFWSSQTGKILFKKVIILVQDIIYYSRIIKYHPPQKNA